MLIDSALHELKGALRGQVLGPADSDYDSARGVFNGMIDRRPAVIARCAGAADVITCVRFATQHQLPVSIRGGGHSVSGTAVCDAGLMIDLCRMKTLRIDPVGKTARADPGLLLGEFDCEAQAFGLATTLGTFSPTGITGLTLGGGLGWLMGKHGLACDNLLSVDIVTADGCLLVAGAEQNSDLFWGVRGGSGNFGVVTSLEYRLHPLGPVFAGLVAHPPSEARKVLRFFCDFAKNIPDELGLMAAMLTLPDGNTVVGMAGCYSGELKDAERVLKPLRSFGSPLADHFTVMPYTAFQKALDWWAVPAQRHYWKSGFMQEVSDSAIDVMADFGVRKPSSGSGFGIEILHGRAARVPHDATAFAHRDKPYNFLMLGNWASAAEDDAAMCWIGDFWKAMAPSVAGGVYVNYLSSNEGEDRVRAAYGANYERLVHLKNKYDPSNFFRVNQNIRGGKSAASQ